MKTRAGASDREQTVLTSEPVESRKSNVESKHDIDCAVPSACVRPFSAKV